MRRKNSPKEEQRCGHPPSGQPTQELADDRPKERRAPTQELDRPLLFFYTAGTFVSSWTSAVTCPRSRAAVVFMLGVPSASFLTRCRGSRLLRPRRCGDFGLVSRHKPAEHRFLMFPLFPTLRRRASHTEEQLRHQRLSHAGVRLRYQRLSDYQSFTGMSWPEPRASRSSSHRDKRWEGCRV